MHVIMEMLWKRRGDFLLKNRIVMFDPYFTKLIQSSWDSFKEDENKLQFVWPMSLASYVTGKGKGKGQKMELGRDVDVVYAPMNWGDEHWVGLCINLATSNVTIFDSYIPFSATESAVEVHMAPLLSSLPYILEQFVGYTKCHTKEGIRYFSWSREVGLYHNEKSGDCGACAAKFMEIHANGSGKAEMSQITDKTVERFREQYAMDCYEDFVGDFKLQNTD